MSSLSRSLGFLTLIWLVFFIPRSETETGIPMKVIGKIVQCLAKELNRTAIEEYVICMGKLPKMYQDNLQMCFEDAIPCFKDTYDAFYAVHYIPCMFDKIFHCVDDSIEKLTCDQKRQVKQHVQCATRVMKRWCKNPASP